MLSFILLGQSNMAGRGDFGEVPAISHDRIKMLRNGRGHPMSEPICPDRAIFGQCHSGISLAASFALDYVDDHPQDTIGLVPCADGGTNLHHDWQPGGLLFDNAVFLTRQAQRTSTVAGILWHQGESDGDSPEHAASYRQNFDIVFGSFLRATGLEGVPVVIGELGHFLAYTRKWGEHLPVLFHQINRDLEQIAHDYPHAAIARADGLSCKADEIHFNSKSLRQFGHRYYQAYKSIVSGMQG